jgi:hypothetical protein
MNWRRAAAAAICTVVATSPSRAETRPIDTERSVLTVLVYRSGLFSAFADDHVIRAPIGAGSISLDGPLAVEISVKATSLTVLDPKAAADKRADVETRMLGPEVLDTARFPTITFASTTVEPAGTDRWTVTGRLSLHGVTRPAVFSVKREDGRYRGTVTLKQSDFGITPISIGGGVVKVKDELKVEFDVIAER